MWVVPWLAGGWWRDRVERNPNAPGPFPERRVGAVLAAVAITSGIVLVHRFGYAPALIDAVPDARSNTTPPTLYTAVIGLAQVGVLMTVARPLDRIGRRWRRLWDRAGEAAVGVYAWHLTALALCAALVAAGLPVPERLTLPWWLTRPLWWAAVLGVTAGLVLLTDAVGRHFRRSPTAGNGEAPSGRWVLLLGVVALTAGGAVVGLEGPRSIPLAATCSTLFVGAWLLLRRSRS